MENVCSPGTHHLEESCRLKLGLWSPGAVACTRHTVKPGVPSVELRIEVPTPQDQPSLNICERGAGGGGGKRRAGSPLMGMPGRKHIQ